MVFIGIIIPIIVFCVIINGVYAYFTATAIEEETSTSTGTLMLQLSADTDVKINKNSIATSQKVFPGDTLSFDGTLENAGTHAFYAIFQFEVIVTKKASGSTPEIVESNYYTFVDSTLTEIEITTSEGGETSYSSTAFILEAANEEKTNTYTKTFSIGYLFDGDKYGDDYENASITFSFNAYAIQSSAIGTPEDATKILIDRSNEQ